EKISITPQPSPAAARSLPEITLVSSMIPVKQHPVDTTATASVGTDQICMPKTKRPTRRSSTATTCVSGTAPSALPATTCIRPRAGIRRPARVVRFGNGRHGREKRVQVAEELAERQFGHRVDIRVRLQPVQRCLDLRAHQFGLLEPLLQLHEAVLGEDPLEHP